MDGRVNKTTPLAEEIILVEKLAVTLEVPFSFTDPANSVPVV